ncbi:hypothetical protein VTL71DRAFT_5220 [Oculimacula yallundae]|uniref:Uncharacterized protein n=1 Tax=Oculimacula yallundae TaxID=86028 RepID=A0ABR4C148_9HELO
MIMIIQSAHLSPLQYSTVRFPVERRTVSKLAGPDLPPSLFVPSTHFISSCSLSFTILRHELIRIRPTRQLIRAANNTHWLSCNTECCQHIPTSNRRTSARDSRFRHGPF